jgi:hypothetical protein
VELSPELKREATENILSATLPAMDFKGDLPAEAAKALIDHLEHLAVEGGGLLRVNRGGITRQNWAISGPGFRVRLQFDAALVVRLKIRMNLFSRRFGRGWIFTSTTVDKIELRLDNEGQFRWHRYAGAVSRRGFAHRLRYAHWFPLTAEYLAESVTAEPATYQPQKIVSIR